DSRAARRVSSTSTSTASSPSSARSEGVTSWTEATRRCGWNTRELYHATPFPRGKKPTPGRGRYPGRLGRRPAGPRVRQRLAQQRHEGLGVVEPGVVAGVEQAGQRLRQARQHRLDLGGEGG